MLNICRPVVSELWKIDQPDTVSVFLRTSQGDRSLGSPANLTLASTTSSPHPQIIMTNGAPCSASPVLSSSIISFVCAAPGGASAGPELVAMLPPGADASESCAFLFEWRTPAACPKVAGGGHLGDVGAVAVLFAMYVASSSLHAVFSAYLSSARDPVVLDAVCAHAAVSSMTFLASFYPTNLTNFMKHTSILSGPSSCSLPISLELFCTTDLS